MELEIGPHTIHHGDSRDVLAAMPDNCVDAVVTDPPYALVSIVKRFGQPGAAPAKGNDAYARASAGFMGQSWDTGEVAFATEFWAQVLRVLKPGGHVVAFSGTRTYHRLAVAIEDSGFEIRDQLAWVYGSGFPKSHDVSKAIDKAGGNPLAWRKFSEQYAKIVEASNFTHSDIDRHLGIKSSSCYWGRTDHRGGMPPRHHWEMVKEYLSIGTDFDSIYDEAEREIIGTREKAMSGWNADGTTKFVDRDITRPATPQAQQWEGWGTALKPAWEPIVLARKPLIGTVAANVLEHGTGAINIDGCRVHAEDAITESPEGRFPANILHDGEQFGENGRYFYSPKASKKDRGEGNIHPTVKPTDLMAYLCRLVTPPGGVVLDPFMGSGSTGKGAHAERFRFIGIEREENFFEIAGARLMDLT